MVAASVFALTNTVLVTVVLALEGKANIAKTLTGPALGFVVSVFVTAAAGGVLAELAQRGPGDWMVAGVVAVCFFVGMSLSLVRDRNEKAMADRAG